MVSYCFLLGACESGATFISYANMHIAIARVVFLHK